MILEILTGLSFISNEAKKSHLEIPARIVTVARDEITHWAANRSMGDKRHKQFVKEMEFEKGLFVALDFIARYASINDETLRKQIVELIEKANAFAASRQPETSE